MNTPFTDQDAFLLSSAGYLMTHYDAEWKDVGGPENGPHLSGHPDFDEWHLQGIHHSVIVVDDEVVEAYFEPYEFEDIPF